jgi:hypothetical protein
MMQVPPRMAAPTSLEADTSLKHAQPLTGQQAQGTGPADSACGCVSMTSQHSAPEGNQ